MTEKNAAAFESFGAKFDAAVSKKVPDGAEKARKSVGLLDEQWKKMTSSFTAASLLDRGITTITNGLVDVIQHARATATTMTDLSDRTGHSVEFLQRAGYAARVAGFDFDKFSAGAFTLGVKLAGGSGSVRAAVESLGLKWDELLAMNVDDRMTAVTQALAAMVDPTERNRAAVALFGGAAKTATDAAAAGWDKVGEAAIVASRAQLEAIKRGETAWKQFTSWIYGTGMKAFADLADEVTGTAASVDSLTEKQQQEFIVQTKLGRGHLYLIEVQRERTKGQRDIELATASATSATDKYAAANAQAYQDLYTLNAEQRKQILGALELGASQEELANDYGVSQAAIKLLESETKKQASADKAAADDAKTHAAERKKLAEETEKTNKAFRDSVSIMGTAAGNWRMWQPLAVGSLDSASTSAQQFYAEMGRTLTAIDLSARAWEPFKKGVADSRKELAGLVTSTKSMSDWAKGLPNLIVGALQGGGNVGQSIGASLFGQIFQSGGASQKAIEAGASKLFGAGVGAAIGSAVPGLGTLVGSVAGQLSQKFFGKLFKSEGKEVNNLRDTFVASMGGIDALAAKAQAAGTNVDNLLRARNKDQLQKAIDEINASLGRQQADLDLAKQAMEEWGISATEAGQKFAQAEIDEEADRMMRMFTAAQRAGVDMNAIIAKGGDDFGKLAQRAIETGTTIPAAMRPVYAAMIEQGTLIDANGEKFTDLSQIPFAETIESAVTNLSTVMKEFKDAVVAAFPAQFKASGDAGVEMGAKIAGGIRTATGSAIELQHKVGGINWRGMADDAIEALRDVEDSVNAVSFGHSPGGLKEYPLLLGKAGSAMKTWRRDWAAELRAVEAQVNETGLPAMSRATNYAAAATGELAAAAMPQSAAQASPTAEFYADLYLAVDPMTGAVRQVQDRREIDRMVQQGLREGRYSLPVRNVTGRAA